jgi:putative phage-type endonuclease
MEQRSAEWFKARRGKITGSSVGAILGYSPFMTPDDVMRRMVREYHGAESEFKGNVATEWGVANESGALVEYEMETGNKVMPCGFFRKEDWLGASPDGLIGTEGLVEVKCPFSLRKGDGVFKTARDQMHYYAQMQFQLYVTDRRWCDFYQWSPKATYLEVVEYDEAFMAESLPKLFLFYANYLEEIKNPDRHLSEKRPEFNGSQILAEYDDAVTAIKLYEDRKKELLAKLVEIAGNKNASFGGRKLTHVEKAGVVSYAKVVKDHLPHLDLEPYRGEPSAYWKLS